MTVVTMAVCTYAGAALARTFVGVTLYMTHRLSEATVVTQAAGHHCSILYIGRCPDQADFGTLKLAESRLGCAAQNGIALVKSAGNDTSYNHLVDIVG